MCHFQGFSTKHFGGWNVEVWRQNQTTRED